MKSQKIFSYFFILFFFLTTLISFHSCSNANASEKVKPTLTTEKPSRKVNKKLKDYWFDGNAEISSYNLEQVRYGEVHKGTATLVYVTEPFSKNSNTKADYPNKNNVSVLKLNTTKKFTTGIYPYSMMNSTFFPFENESSSLKIASSMQEWCGMTYVEMKNKKDLIFNFNSYFEGASFKNKKISKAILEDDLWSYIRLNPESLPTEKHTVIPSFFYLNSMHKDFKGYEADITLDANDTFTVYKIEYPSLHRVLEITFSSNFPYKIISWKETYDSGYGKNRKTSTTKATLLKTLKIDYWNKNKNSDHYLRKELKLED
ncbi:septum formation inhibitor Maf [Tenacibaculum sp. M341]|uniref:septum formation inhibitor Maf n=1 Tax=Tenacibaculum sp. M341 TaxID=2530339 RepID=UPI00104FED41|nr:septum formation inhibitor Maf [Tenacibaculum sp. M341]TCI85123.1 septum formation inhibitor Maf [Tenacibaculum sp. M341]